MHRFFLLALLAIPLHVYAVKAFFSEWDSKEWNENKFCAVGAFENRTETRLELCAITMGTEVTALWFDLESKSFRTPPEALAGLPDLQLEDALISVEPCGAALAMISGQSLKRPIPNCYTISIPLKQNARKLLVIEFEDQRYVTAKTSE